MPGWFKERADRLHRICCSIDSRSRRGEKLRRLVYWFAWNSKGKSYKCDSERPLNFTRGVIRRALYTWRLGGQVPAALIPRYKSHGSKLTALPIIRIVDFLTACPQPTLKAALTRFTALGGRGRGGIRPLKISYDQLRRHLPASLFRKVRIEQRALAVASKNLNALRIGAIADIRERLPDRQPRPRAKCGNDFQI